MLSQTGVVLDLWDVGLPKDKAKAKAFKLFERCISAGSGSGDQEVKRCVGGSLHHMGLLMMSGFDGQPSNPKRANEYWFKAFDHGFTDAAFNISSSFHLGNGLPADTAKSKEMSEGQAAAGPDRRADRRVPEGPRPRGRARLRTFGKCQGLPRAARRPMPKRCSPGAGSSPAKTASGSSTGSSPRGSPRRRAASRCDCWSSTPSRTRSPRPTPCSVRGAAARWRSSPRPFSDRSPSRRRAGISRTCRTKRWGTSSRRRATFRCEKPAGSWATTRRSRRTPRSQNPASSAP